MPTTHCQLILALVCEACGEVGPFRARAQAKVPAVCVYCGSEFVNYQDVKLVHPLLDQAMQRWLLALQTAQGSLQLEQHDPFWVATPDASQGSQEPHQDINASQDDPGPGVNCRA